ncbi:hypothetical protein MBLNU230_g3375t1 [Neophaeotheca triangularis]
MPPLEKTIYTGPFVHSKSLSELEICPEGTIGVAEDGKIAFINRSASASPPQGWSAAKTLRLPENSFYFPGFIDTHIHAPQYPNAGVFGKSTLLDWLNTYTFPLESSFRALPQARKVYNRVVARTLSHGTTTACYYATNHVPATNLLADICQQRGQRAFVGRVCMDRLSPDDYRDESTESAIAATRECVEYCQSIDAKRQLITPILTPRFAPACSGESMRGLAGLQRELDLPCQTHVCENKAEIELVKELFPESESYVHVYDDVGLLNERMILAHAVHLTDGERKLIQKRDAKISHCPASNTALTSGTAKVRELLDAGITVGLGTDVSGGYTPSMLSEAREAIFVSRHAAMADGDRAKLSTEEALYLATRGGAKVVGLEDRIGGFEAGMDWDAQMVSLGNTTGDAEINPDDGLVEIFGTESWDDRIAKWVYTGDDRNTAAVWVKGRLVHTSRNFACSKAALQNGVKHD